MDILSLIGLAVIVTLVLVIITSIFADADLSTIYYEHFGKNVSKELEGKVVWITGASAGQLGLVVTL